MGTIYPGQHDKNVSISLDNFATLQDLDSLIQQSFDLEKSRRALSDCLIKIRCADLIDGKQYIELTRMLSSVDHENHLVAAEMINNFMFELDSQHTYIDPRTIP